MIFRQYQQILPRKKRQTRRVCRADDRIETTPDRVLSLEAYLTTTPTAPIQAVYRGGPRHWAVGRDYAVQRKRARPGITYRTRFDGELVYAEGQPYDGFSWHPLRIRLQQIRVMCLQDIHEHDAVAEGCTPVEYRLTARGAFMQLWEDIHGDGAWAENPLVYALSFVPWEDDHD